MADSAEWGGMAAKMAKANGGWKCPKCGREFAQRSPYHGCGKFTVEGYLAGKNRVGVALFEMLAAELKQFSEVVISPAKSQITFRVRSNFLMVAVSGVSIHGYLFLPREVARPYFKKIVRASSRRHAHQFRIADAATLQNDFMKLLPEAIALVSEAEEEVKEDLKSGKRIGEEINAVYRSARRVAA